MVTAATTRRSIFLSVDDGTGSARAGLFDEQGKLLGSASSPIQIWKEGDYVEQSSTDIWHAICTPVKAARSLANISGEDVSGIEFAATCSLVAVDADGSPVTVSWSGDSRRNIIVWMDHGAIKQAEKINSSNSPVLQYCGGAMSPELQSPKLLWVKENLRESWSLVFRWMDLSDWLSCRATGGDTRSLCNAVCKWTSLGHAHMQQSEKDSWDMEAYGWYDEFWEEIGLGDFVDSHHAKIEDETNATMIWGTRKSGLVVEIILSPPIMRSTMGALLKNGKKSPLQGRNHTVGQKKKGESFLLSVEGTLHTGGNQRRPGGKKKKDRTSRRAGGSSSFLMVVGLGRWQGMRQLVGVFLTINRGDAADGEAGNRARILSHSNHNRPINPTAFSTTSPLTSMMAEQGHAAVKIQTISRG